MPEIITTAQTAEEQKIHERREAIRRSIDAVLKHKSGTPERWRAAIALYLNMNPREESGYTAKAEYRKLVTENIETRQIQNNQYATNESGSMRLGLSAPSWFMQIIEAFDREAFDQNNPKAKDNFRKLCKEFSEFRIMEKI